MLQILLAFTVLATCVVAMAYGLKGLTSVKVVAITALTLLGVFSYNQYVDRLGFPIPTQPDGEFLYVHHAAQGDDIILWAYTEGKGNRLYSFKYDQDTMEKLEDAKEASEEGGGIGGVFEEGVVGDGIRTLETHDWVPNNATRVRKE